MNTPKKETDRCHEYFMDIALREAEKALTALEFPVGCVLVANDTVIATGARKGSTGESPNELDHAEIVALRRLDHMENRIDPFKITAYCTMEPCLMCYAALILSGIGKIVYAYEDVMGGGTGADLSKIAPLYANSKITVIGNVRREESLALFRKFFSNPENRYWEKSLLADYTSSQ